MTESLASAPPLEAVANTGARPTVREFAESLAAILAVVGFTWVLWHSGGRDRGAVEVGLVLTAPLLVACQPWQRLSRLELLTGTAIAVAAVVVPLVTPLGVASVRDLGVYPYGVAAYFAFASYVSSASRRRLLCVSLLMVAAVEALPVWRVWLDEHDPAYMMVGTIYWHNQFGAFAAAIGLFGAALAMRSRLVDDALGWLIGSLFLALTVLSHSRGSWLALSVGAAALATVAVRRRAWGALARLVGVASVAALIVLGFIAAAHSRGAPHAPQAIPPDTLSSTSSLRLGLGTAALHVFASSPLTSHGFGSFLLLEPRYLPDGATMSRWVHSAELQSLTDGGLLLGVPVLLALVLIVVRWLRTLAATPDDGGLEDWAGFGAAAAGIALVLHMSMDFDSQYPLLVGLVAVMASVPRRALPERRGQQGASADRAIRPIAFAATVAAISTASVLVHAYWTGQSGLQRAEVSAINAPQAAVDEAVHLMKDASFADPRAAVYLVQLRAQGVPVDTGHLRRALAGSRNYAQLDRDFGRVWTEVNDGAGRPVRSI